MHDPHRDPHDQLEQEEARAWVELLQHQRLLSEQQKRLEKLLIEGTTKIMAAIDDLKTNIAALIAEGTADVTALVQKLQTQAGATGGASESDLATLAANVAQATTALHSAFQTATGVPVPATNASGEPSNAIDPSAPATGDQSGSQSSAPASSPEPAPTQDSAPAVTTIGPDSFKSGA